MDACVPAQPLPTYALSEPFFNHFQLRVAGLADKGNSNSDSKGWRGGFGERATLQHEDFAYCYNLLEGHLYTAGA